MDLLTYVQQVQGRHAGLTGGMMVGDVPPGIVNMPRCPLCAMVFSSQLEAIQHQKFCNKGNTLKYVCCGVLM